MTGSAALARDIWNLTENQNKWGAETKKMRDAGWQFVGSGSTRAVYLGPDGVVYKVGDPLCNILEARASRKLRNNRTLRSLNVHVPRARTFKVAGDYNVSAMDYVPSKRNMECKSFYELDNDENWVPSACDCGNPRDPHPCFGFIMLSAEKAGIQDMFSGNIIYSTDRRFYLIDLGYQGWDSK